MQDHLTNNTLFNQFQSAYTKFHSTETVLLCLQDHLIRAMASQQITCLCLLDLSAAFDTIDHTILLTRLTDWFGISGTVHNWFESYLTSRAFSVSISDNKSTSTKLDCGVPQGSVLGPLLFIMYTTPLSSLLTSTSVSHHLYADDTQLFISFSPGEFTTHVNQLQSVFSSVSAWMSSNLLALNPSKTEFLIVGLPGQLSKLNNPAFCLDTNTTLVPVSHARNLGFILDENLACDHQLSAVTRSCNYHLRDLRRIRHTLDFNTACTVATALVHSKLDYCNSLYLNIPAYQLHRLQSIQNSMARAVSCTSKYEHITPTIQALHWLKIDQRIKYKIISLTYSALQFGQPQYLRQLLTIQQTRCTRSSSVITLVRPHTTRRKIEDRSFYHSAPTLWNKLPVNMRTPSLPASQSSTRYQAVLELSRSQFLSRLKTHLFTDSYPP